jgi:hypothetical protein
MSDVRTSDVIDLAEDIPALISSAENVAATSAPPAISEAAQLIELSEQWWNQSGIAVTSHATHDLIV